MSQTSAPSFRADEPGFDGEAGTPRAAGQVIPAQPPFARQNT